MSLRGKKPSSIQKRLKCLMYGAAGVGKTTAAISFPKPYLIDTERGAENAQYVQMLEKNGGVIFQTTDFDELLTEVKALLTEKHDYKTLVIDPMTTIYNNLVEKCGQRKNIGTEFGRHYSEANKEVKKLLNLLLRLDMNIVVTSHSKNEYGGKMEVLGQTFDCYKKLDYLFDLALEIQKKGKTRMGLVRKSRLVPFEEGETFEFSYEEMASRYGRDIIEKEYEAQVLATPEQVAELKHLVSLFKIAEEVQDKWLEKAHASSFDEMEASIIEKCISSLTSKLGKMENVA